jgi:hypothetical protein
MGSGPDLTAKGRGQGGGDAEMTAVRFLVRHAVVGIAAALVFSALLFFGDVGGLRRLANADESGWLYLALLFFGLAVTFGSAAMGISVMGLGRERDER